MLESPRPSDSDVESKQVLGRILEQVRNERLARDEETLRTGKAGRWPSGAKTYGKA